MVVGGKQFSFKQQYFKCKQNKDFDHLEKHVSLISVHQDISEVVLGVKKSCDDSCDLEVVKQLLMSLQL